MKLEEFKDSVEVVIHCHTEEEAQKLQDKFQELGFKTLGNSLNLGDSLNNSFKYLPDVCYSMQGTYGSLSWYQSYNYKIIEFDELEDFKSVSKLKVGDKVRVRKDLRVGEYKGNNGGGILFTPPMLKYKGQLLTITGLSTSGNYGVEDGDDWYWSDEMLEPVGKSSILYDIEFDYLSAVIKPFKDSVEYIKKVDGFDKYYIDIDLGTESICLPYFPKDSDMYKGMEVDKHYTLEELGFVEPKPKLLNGKFVCVKSNCEAYTVGKIYEFKDGQTKFNDGYLSGKYESLEDFNDSEVYINLIPLVED